MENLITWLERQIEGCDNLGGMEKEKWAFIQTLKKVREKQLNIHSVSKSFYCLDNALGQLKCNKQCLACKKENID